MKRLDSKEWKMAGRPGENSRPGKSANRVEKSMSGFVVDTRWAYPLQLCLKLLDRFQMLYVVNFNGIAL